MDYLMESPSLIPNIQSFVVSGKFLGVAVEFVLTLLCPYLQML